MRSLLTIACPDLELIVINDRPTGATPAIIEQVAAGAPRMRVVQVRELPAGWPGRNHAPHQGAAIAGGDYLTLSFDLQARSSLLRLAWHPLPAGGPQARPRRHGCAGAAKAEEQRASSHDAAGGMPRDGYCEDLATWHQMDQPLPSPVLTA